MVYHFSTRLAAQQGPRQGPLQGKAPAAPRVAKAGGCPAAGRFWARPVGRVRGMRQTLQGSFSAVSKRNFASKYAFDSSRRDLHNGLLCTVL